MSDRSRFHRESFHGSRGFSPKRCFVRGPPPPESLLEDLEIQDAEIRRLLRDNHLLDDDQETLVRELGAAKEEMHRMNLVISEICSEHELRLREFGVERCNLEEDVRVMESYKHEALELRSEVRKLNDVKRELSGDVKILRKDLVKLQAENKEIPVARAEIKNLQEELVHARAAIDYEKKEKFELMEQRHTMEKDLVSMAREIEVLRKELATFDSRQWGAGGSYGMNFNNADGPYGDKP